MTLQTREEFINRASAKQAAEQKEFEKFLEQAYGHLHRLVEELQPRVYFSQRGAERLTHIAGYILAMAQAGGDHQVFAKRMFLDLYRTLRQLAPADREVEYDGDNNTKLKVPPSKCILYDDGTLHSFSVLWLRAIAPARFNEVLTECLAERKALIAAGNKETYLPSAYDSACTKLQVRARVENPDSPQICEWRWNGGARGEVHYTVSHNGGLIYHGPGRGQTFTVSLDTSGCLWGIHT